MGFVGCIDFLVSIFLGRISFVFSNQLFFFVLLIHEAPSPCALSMASPAARDIDAKPVRPDTHYAVLGLPGPPARPTGEAIRAAYRRALLRHHPDKRILASASAELKGTDLIDSTTNQIDLTHPSPTYSPAVASASASVSVDQIITAYRLLSDPATRATYDRALLLGEPLDGEMGEGCGIGVGPGRSQAGEGQTADVEGKFSGFGTGLEMVDLDDMEMIVEGEGEGQSDEEGGGGGESVWMRGCRCGDARGFVVREAELEAAAAEAEAGSDMRTPVGEGEVVVGCSGCSLWIRVVFAVE